MAKNKPHSIEEAATEGLPSSKGRVRLCFDFPSKEEMIDFFNGLKVVEQIPDAATIYKMDGLDQLKGSGITQANTYVVRKKVVRKKGERQEQRELK